MWRKENTGEHPKEEAGEEDVVVRGMREECWEDKRGAKGDVAKEKARSEWFVRLHSEEGEKDLY